MTLPSDDELERLRLKSAQLAAHEAPPAPATLVDRVITTLREEKNVVAIEARPTTSPALRISHVASFRLRTVLLVALGAIAVALAAKRGAEELQPAERAQATPSTAPRREKNAVGEPENGPWASRYVSPGEVPLLRENERHESTQQAGQAAQDSVSKKKPRRLVWALFRDATGLVDKTRVQIACRKVGTVVRRELPPEYRNQAKVTIQIDDKNLAVWDDAVVFKRSASTLGEFYLEIDPGHPETLDSNGNKIKHHRLEDGDQIRIGADAPRTPDKNLPEQLKTSDIQRGIEGVEGRILSCHAHGMANVTFTIDPSGCVSSAQVTGEFANTPTGTCIASAVREASFPPFKGPAINGGRIFEW